VIAQEAVKEKSNEIPALRSMLKDKDIEGCIITADAMHTQKETARFIVQDKKADYVFTVKDNQKNLLMNIKALDLESIPPVYETVDNAHGRIEIRRIRCSSELQGYIDFPFHKQVALIERIVERNGRTSRELAYIITSLDKYRVCPERLLKLNPWTLDNREWFPLGQGRHL